MKRSDLQCFWAKECVKNCNLGFPDAYLFLKLPKDNQDAPAAPHLELKGNLLEGLRGIDTFD